MDRPIPPGPREPEITPRAHRWQPGAARHGEERAKLRQSQSFDRIALVNEHHERVIAIANVETARDHIDAGGRGAKPFLERRDLGRPDLPPHESEVPAPGIKRANGRCRAHEMILEANIGLVLLEAALPRIHESADEVSLAIIGAMTPNADGAGDAPLRVIRRRQIEAGRTRWRGRACKRESQHESERHDGPHCRRSSCSRRLVALSGRYAPSLTTMCWPWLLRMKRRNSFTRGSMGAPGGRSRATSTVRSSGYVRASAVCAVSAWQGLCPVAAMRSAFVPRLPGSGGANAIPSGSRARLSSISLQPPATVR